MVERSRFAAGCDSGRAARDYLSFHPPLSVAGEAEQVASVVHEPLYVGT